MKAMEDLKELLEQELKKIAKKGDITPTELDSVYKAVDVIKDIATIKAMEESGSEESKDQYMKRGGYSQNSMNSMGGASMEGMSNHYPMMMRYRYPYMDGPIWNQSNDGMSHNMLNRGSYEGGSNAGGSYDGSYGRGSYEGSYRGSYEGGSNDGGSYTSYDGASNAGRRGRDGDGDGQYSERRGRDRMGRFTSRDGGSYESSNGAAYRGYSRHTAKERMIGKLESMLEDAQSEREKMAIRQCMEELEG